MCVMMLAAGVNHIANFTRTALRAALVWDGELNASCAVLYSDPDNTGEITELRQYVFTEWDPTASSDMEALASVFDTNEDGELSGAELDEFRIMVTNADGMMSTNNVAQNAGVLALRKFHTTNNAKHRYNLMRLEQ